MKKIIVITTAVMLAAGSCSCGKKQTTEKPVKLAEKFTLNAEFSDGELEAAAEMTRVPEGWEITMTAPERVEGMTFELSEMECMARFGELSYPVATETMPDSSPLLLTARALDKCVLKGNSGTVTSQSYLLTSKDGKPDTLRVGSMTVTLTDYEPK